VRTLRNVVDPPHATTTVEHRLGRFLGRTRELATATAIVGRPPAIVRVEGEQGIGKSRFVRELLTDGVDRTHRVVFGQVRTTRERSPYGAVLQALGQLPRSQLAAAELSPLAGVLRSHLPELADVLPTTEGGAKASTPHDHLCRAVREVVAASGRLVIVIEDVHNADPRSLDLLRFLVADPPRNLSLVLTYRRRAVSGEAPLGDSQEPTRDAMTATIDLEPLDVQDVQRLAGDILGQEWISAEFASRLRDRTAGIPFVVVAMLHALGTHAVGHAGEPATSGQIVDAMDVPSTIRSAMLARLAELPADAQHIARTAAVLQGPVSLNLLSEISGLGVTRTRRATVSALDNALLHESVEGCYTFRHQLGARAVYDAIPGPERAQLHLTASRALRRREPPPLASLAEHSRRAGEYQHWLWYAESAADRAAESGDAATATRVLLPLLAEGTLSPDDADRLAAKLSGVVVDGLDQHVPARVLESLITDGRLSCSARGEVRLAFGLLLVRHADHLESGRLEVTLAVDELVERPVLRRRGMSVLAQPSLGTTPVSECVSWLDRMDIELADRGEWPTTGLLANTAAARLSLGDRSAWSMIAALPGGSVEPAEQRNLARAYCNLADACSWTGHYRRAQRLLRSGTRLARDAGATVLAGVARSTRVHLDWLTGNWGGLTERARLLYEQYRDLHPVASELCLILGNLAVANGEWDAARRHLAHTGMDAPENAVTQVVLDAYAATVRMRNAQGNHAAAADAADRGMRIVQRKGVWVWAGELAPAAVTTYLAAARTADAHAVVDGFAALRGTCDAPATDAAIAMCEGILAVDSDQPERATERLNEAQDRARQLQAPYFAARAAERLATYRIRRGEVDGAAALTATADEFDMLGAAHDAARCRYLLRKQGTGQPSRRGRRGYGAELSPRERDVQRLLADGHTNRQIADALYLSPRTVEQHVARVLRKLGVRSRSDVCVG